MALDTRDKRASTALMMMPFRRTLPVADGTLGVTDRQHIAFLSSAIQAGAAVVADDFLCGFVLVQPMLGGQVSSEPAIGGYIDANPC